MLAVCVSWKGPIAMVIWRLDDLLNLENAEILDRFSHHVPIFLRMSLDGHPKPFVQPGIA